MQRALYRAILLLYKYIPGVQNTISAFWGLYVARKGSTPNDKHHTNGPRPTVWLGVIDLVVVIVVVIIADICY